MLGFSLEVVRGRGVGRSYPIGPGEVVIGRGPGAGVDLGDQDPDGPRRVAERQAIIDATGPTIRDLDSPGGTFVNRRRVLPGQALTLQPGDVVRVGSVELKLVATAAPTAPGTFAVAGTACRTWDDVLAVSAQRWGLLREELASGKLAAALVASGRGEFAPAPNDPGSPDDRLDAWIARLPTTKPARPELDVYPARLVVRVRAGGGTTRRTLRVGNVGHRLLRATARVEPAGTPWLAIGGDFAGRPFVTAEGLDLPLDLTLPDPPAGPLRAAVIIEGNGGRAAVEIVLEPIEAVESPPDRKLHLSFANLPIGLRIAWLAGIGVVARLAIGLASLLPLGHSGSGAGMRGVALVGAGAGLLAGLVGAIRRGGWRDALPCGFAAGCAGVVLGAIALAAVQSVEPLLGPVPGSPVLGCGLWAAIGAGLGSIAGRTRAGQQI